MPFSLPSVNLATAVVGTTGKIVLQNMGISAGGISANPSLYGQKQLPSIQFFNDSGCGLQMVCKSGGQSFSLPAGAWQMVNVSPGESEIDWTVVYLLPNPPVSLLLMDYYAPSEVNSGLTLGNSPVGVGGSVTTSGSTLSNEGNAANTLVVDIGDASLAQLWRIFTDHFIISVDQSGVAHAVLQGNTTGNPLKIGQAGDTSEVLGQLLIDQLLTAAAAGTGLSVTNNQTIGGTLGVTGNVTHSADTFLVNKKLSTASSGDLCDWSGTGVTLKGNPSTNGEISYAGDGTHTDWQLAVVAPVFTGTGGGTFSHNATQFGAAIAPTDFIGNPCTTNGSSNANGFGTITTTQVTVSSLNTVAWRYNAVVK